MALTHIVRPHTTEKEAKVVKSELAAAKARVRALRAEIDALADSFAAPFTALEADAAESARLLAEMEDMELELARIKALRGGTSGMTIEEAEAVLEEQVSCPRTRCCLARLTLHRLTIVHPLSAGGRNATSRRRGPALHQIRRAFQKGARLSPSRIRPSERGTQFGRSVRERSCARKWQEREGLGVGACLCGVSVCSCFCVGRFLRNALLSAEEADDPRLARPDLTRPYLLLHQPNLSHTSTLTLLKSLLGVASISTPNDREVRISYAPERVTLCVRFEKPGGRIVDSEVSRPVTHSA